MKCISVIKNGPNDGNYCNFEDVFQWSAFRSILMHRLCIFFITQDRLYLKALQKTKI